MAVFLPALLLCSAWRMRAEISLKPGTGSSGSAYFELDSSQRQLHSHYLSAVPYQNPTLEHLRARWAKSERQWTLEPSSEVIDLGETAFIPDFVIRHPNGHQVYLEILGFWTPTYLRRRLAEFAHAGLKNFLLAAWDDLRGSREPLTQVPPHTIIFKTNLDPAQLELTANQLIAEQGIA
jgi:hypothetical protein